MSDLTIEPLPTLDPDVVKFVTNQTLNPGAPRACYDAASAGDDPLAGDLFAVEGVAGFMIVNDFCSVHKYGSAAWDDLIPRIESILRAHWGGA